MPDVGVKKVQETLPALQGAFSQFDEVAIYTYSSTVSGHGLWQGRTEADGGAEPD